MENTGAAKPIRERGIPPRHHQAAFYDESGMVGNERRETGSVYSAEGAEEERNLWGFGMSRSSAFIHRSPEATNRFCTAVERKILSRQRRLDFDLMK